MAATATGPDTILSKRMLTSINGALAKVNSALQECDLAEGCGVDCTAERDELENARTMLNTIKSTYHPEAK